MLSSYQLYQYSQCSQFNSTARHFINYYFTVSICTVAVYYTLKYYMQGSLFFSKKTALHNVLECYMHSSLLFSKNTAVYYSGMLYARQINSVCSF